MIRGLARARYPQRRRHTVASLLFGFVSSVLLARWLGLADRDLRVMMLTVAGLRMILGGICLPQRSHTGHFAELRERESDLQLEA